jgi:predicted neuraminidase
MVAIVSFLSVRVAMPFSVNCRGLALLVGLGLPVAACAAEPGVIASQFIFEKVPFPQCHASTIDETKGGLVAAWFGGTREKDPDVGIWLSRHEDSGRGRKWSPPVEIANGLRDGKRYPTWNPVLFQQPEGPLLLFFKVGPSPSTWWGEVIASDDGGKSWGKPRRLPEGIAGPIKNRPVLLAGGTLLAGSSTEHDGWRVHMEWTKDGGQNWARGEPLNDGRKLGAIQPTILQHHNVTGGDVKGSAKLQILCRSRQGRIAEAWSEDGGKTWSEMKLTALPNPNSGIHAVTLKDGRHLLVYNHTLLGRSPLNVAVSTDGRDWKAGPVLESEPGEYSYPTVMQASDGRVHVTYTWKRQRIKHVVLEPAKLELKALR